MWLANPNVVIIIPIFLLLMGAVVKKIIRGTGWEIKDFYMGVELALAAMSATLIYTCDTARAIEENRLSSKPLANSAGLATMKIEAFQKLANTQVFIVVSFIFFLFLVATHQQYEKHTNDSTRNWVLLGASNLLGLTLVIICQRLIH